MPTRMTQEQMRLVEFLTKMVENWDEWTPEGWALELQAEFFPYGAATEDSEVANEILRKFGVDTLRRIIDEA